VGSQFRQRPDHGADVVEGVVVPAGGPVAPGEVLEDAATLLDRRTKPGKQAGPAGFQEGAVVRGHGRNRSCLDTRSGEAPQPDDLVHAAGSDAPTVRASGHAVNRPYVPCELM